MALIPFPPLPLLGLIFGIIAAATAKTVRSKWIGVAAIPTSVIMGSIAYVLVQMMRR
jgi:hypothetical protein